MLISNKTVPAATELAAECPTVPADSQLSRSPQKRAEGVLTISLSTSPTYQNPAVAEADKTCGYVRGRNQPFNRLVGDSPADLNDKEEEQQYLKRRLHKHHIFMSLPNELLF